MIDFVMATPDDREHLLGREFRNVYVFAFWVTGATCTTRCILKGRPVTLVGDPIEALQTYLGGTDSRAEVPQ